MGSGLESTVGATKFPISNSQSVPALNERMRRCIVVQNGDVIESLWAFLPDRWIANDSGFTHVAILQFDSTTRARNFLPTFVERDDALKNVFTLRR